MQSPQWSKYLAAFAITSLIFFTALYISSTFNERRIAELRSIEEKISVDILSLETQFDLLEELSCRDISEGSVLSQELGTLEEKLSFTEGQLGADNEEVLDLKRSYSLLQIKDYLLMKRVAEKCSLEPVFIFYFYSNEGDCNDCGREGQVLTYLREQYPKLRVYSFDYNLGVSALNTLISIYDIKQEFPALIINGEAYYGFHSIEEIESILPPLEPKEEAQQDS